MNTQTAYPLSWPPSWPRTDVGRRQKAPFHRKGAPGQFGGRSILNLSMSDVVGQLYGELKLIGVGDYNVIVSTNVELRMDGLPYSNRAAPADPGAAVYFKLKGKPCVLACDKWTRVEDNLSAIARHIEALRGQERWGVGSVEQAFAGYTALPAPGSAGSMAWYSIIGVPHDAPASRIREAYRAAALEAHPDRPGGSHEAMSRLNAAWDQARAQVPGL